MRRHLLALAVLAAACRSPSEPPSPTSPPEEARALWVSRFEYATAANVDAIIARAARANFNVICSAQVLEQIELARARGANGVSIYSYSSMTPEIWSALSAGPFSRPATVPPRRWL